MNDYRFHTEWRDRHGRVWAMPVYLPVGDGSSPDPRLLGDARRSHERALSGRWVGPGMLEAHVSALKVVREGKVLAEDLAPKGDWCDDHERFRCHCEAGRKARTA